MKTQAKVSKKDAIISYITLACIFVGIVWVATHPH